MSLLTTDTNNIQNKLANYCRNGIEVDLPGVIPHRISQYRRLVYNIIDDNLQIAFPITHSYFSEDKWNKMTSDFLENHKCQAYQVWKIAGEFCNYAIENKLSEKYNLPCLNDLLLFEWEEMVLYNMPDLKIDEHKKYGDVINDVLIINPEFKILPLSFPVHTHIPDDASKKQGQYFALLYRDLETGNIQFMDISIWFVYLIEQIAIESKSINLILKEAPTLFGEIDILNLQTTSIAFINDMSQKGFVLGYDME